MSPNLTQCVVLIGVRLIQPIYFASGLLWYSVHITSLCGDVWLFWSNIGLFWSNIGLFCDTLSTLLHSVLASSFPPRQDFSKRASFPIVCVEWFYKKDLLQVSSFRPFRAQMGEKSSIRAWFSFSAKGLFSNVCEMSPTEECHAHLYILMLKIFF